MIPPKRAAWESGTMSLEMAQDCACTAATRASARLSTASASARLWTKGTRHSRMPRPTQPPTRIVFFDAIEVIAYLRARTRVTRPAKRSEEHTSELQSRGHLVCRLLLEKKNCIARHGPQRRPRRLSARANDD